MTLAEAAALALAAWSSAVTSSSLYACARVALRSQTKPTRAGITGDVLVVRPCAGAETSLAHNLASSRDLADAGSFSLVFAVARETDDALPIARAAAESLVRDGYDATVMVTDARGVNQKASQLARAIDARAPRDVVVTIDSDVDCRGLSLGAMADVLRGDDTLGAVWAPPVEDGGETFGDRCSDALLAGSLHAFQVLAALDPRGLVGKVVALRASALAAVGGFSALEAYLGEDMELARRLRAAGYGVKALATPVTSRARRRRWADVVERYARWITVIRAQRVALMASYPGLFFATWPLVICALALASVTDGAAGLTALTSAAAALGARVLVALTARRASQRPLARAFGDVVLADGLLACAFVRALRGAPVRWRGRVLTVERGGTLREL